MSRMMIDVSKLIEAVVGDLQAENELWHNLRSLSDELNSALPEYRVSLEHHDTGDFLTFEQRDAYDWDADQEEQRREIAEILLPPQEDDQ